MRRREQETLRAEHLATVAQMATGVAHELRNPLTAVKMLVQAGREGGPGGMPAEDLEYIEQEIRRMERCLQSYLDFARPRKPERRAMDLADLVDRTLALVQPRAAQQRVELRFARPAAAGRGRRRLGTDPAGADQPGVQRAGRDAPRWDAGNGNPGERAGHRSRCGCWTQDRA